MIAARFAGGIAVLILLCSGRVPLCHSQQTTPLSPIETKTAFSQAEALVRARQWDEGLAILNQLAQRDPRNPRILNLTGLALTGKGEIEQADQTFLRCLTGDPDFLPALKNLGINEYRQHHLLSAEGYLSKALLLSPADPVIQLHLGLLAFDRQDFPRAFQMLAPAKDLVLRDSNATAELAASALQTGNLATGEPLLSRVPPERLDPSMQLSLGLALVHADLFNLALPYLQVARAQATHSEVVNFDLAVAYLGAKDYTKTIETAHNLIEDGHETSEIDNLLAEAYEGNKQTQSAVDALRRAIALDPKAEQNYLDFASLCINHQSYAEGLKVLDVALKVNPQSDRLIFERGILHALENHFDLAERDFEEASARAPKNDLGGLGLGIAYLESGDSKQAIALLRTSLRAHPEDPKLLYLLGEALLRSGAVPGDAAYVEAQQSLEKSVAADPRLELAHVLLGKIYLAQNKNTDAVRELEQARALKPNERSIYSHLATAYRRVGDASQAAQALATLQEINDRDRSAVTARMKNEPKQEDLR